MKKLLIILILFFPKVLMAYECDFDKLVPGKTKKQLEELNKLYKIGVLSEDEFKKAKKKILN